MKRRVITFFAIFIIAALFGFGLTLVVQAQGPHGGYTPTTDACAACHRGHTAGGAGLLASTNQGNAFCNTCHNGVDAPAMSTHTNQNYNGRAEDLFSLDCTQCHEPHGSSNLYAVRESVQVSVSPEITNGPVTFTAITGTNSYDDGASAPDSRICVTCHSNINNAGYPMTNHVGGANHLNSSDYSGQDCTTCHPHDNGFMHGAAGANCIACHGHDAGTLYDPDASYPYTAGTEASLGSGSAQSHSTHTETDADDQRGPAIYCDSCHDINNFPYFNSGVDSNGDGQYDLSETDVCDDCHSPGGTYNGVDDAVIGAKNNWRTGVYTGSNLIPGKEKWCASCHDETPSVISTTFVITAPNVIGDEDGNYTYSAYGQGWGYYKTGHGLPDTETYPASGGITNGAGLGCDGCHDFSTPHIDGLARTFDDGNSSTTALSAYRQGYRLKLVGGQEPMEVPWTTNWPSPPNNADRFRLCYSCHDSGPFTDALNGNTNLKTDGVNRHEYHLRVNQLRYSSDWDGVNNSRMTCVVCHNVHGSTRLTMVRDGALIGREPGLRIWYNNDDVVTYVTWNPDPPDPQDLQLPASTGTVWAGGSSGNLCSNCHGNNNTTPEYRLPFQTVVQTPTLTWTGESSYVFDGVDPDNAPAGSNFEFRIEYTDQNNDAPSPIELWLDTNDNGSYESAEVYTMTGAVATDNNYTDGKIYVKSLALSKAGDNTLNYRFYASDGALTAQTLTRTVTISNNSPTLTWTGEPYFESNGVHPDAGARGSNFEFRVEYADSDGDAPASIQVWIDENENNSYDAGERYTMTAVSGVITTGMIYSYTTPLTDVVDGVISYTFRANDGWDDAITTPGPLANNTVVVTSSLNNPPVLDWALEDCRVNGVKPERGLATGNFEFKVTYTDLDNQCPPANGYVSVWIDENDNSVTDAGETYTMTAASGNCSSGKIYSTTVPLTYNGDGNLEYRFIASDGIDPAAGAPTDAGNEVTVVTTTNASGVRTGSSDFGPIWYNQIQTAIDAVSFQTIMVYPGVYTQNLFISGNPDDGITLESVCGPDMTTINASSGDTVFIQLTNQTVIDGFTVSGGDNGVYIRNTPGIITITNSIIRDNNRGIFSGNGNSRLTISDSVIRNNSGSDSGAGIIYSGNGPHNIINSVIENNAATVNGGGIFIQNVAAGNMLISNTTVSSNSAANLGGGIYLNNSSPDFNKTTISSNTSVSNGGGVYANGSSPIFSKTSIDANTSNIAGGGVFVNGGGQIITLENSNVTGNTGNTMGGGLYLNTGAIAAITNSVVSRNTLLDTAGGRGGGIFANSAAVSIKNSIFWNNQASYNGSGHACYTNGSASVSFTYSDVLNNRNTLAGNYSYSVDATNIEADPLFVGGAPYNYHLRPISPAIDRGTANGAPADDIDGDVRPLGSGIEMGSDEVLGRAAGAMLFPPGESSNALYLPLILKNAGSGATAAPSPAKATYTLYLPLILKNAGQSKIIAPSTPSVIYLPLVAKNAGQEKAPLSSAPHVIYLPLIAKDANYGNSADTTPPSPTPTGAPLPTPARVEPTPAPLAPSPVIAEPTPTPVAPLPNLREPTPIPLP